MASDNDITISRAKFEKLLELAADSIYVRYSEFSNDPPAEEAELMVEMHGIIGKSMSNQLVSVLRMAGLLPQEPEPCRKTI